MLTTRLDTLMNIQLLGTEQTKKWIMKLRNNFKSVNLNVARFGDQGRKDEEVRGDEPKKGV